MVQDMKHQTDVGIVPKKNTIMKRHYIIQSIQLDGKMDIVPYVNHVHQEKDIMMLSCCDNGYPRQPGDNCYDVAGLVRETEEPLGEMWYPDRVAPYMEATCLR